MIRYQKILLLLVLCQFLNSKFCAAHPKDKCALYKNSKFLWWGTDCGKFCHQAGKRVTCMWYQYHQGCFCKDGFYRNRNWDCVPLQGCDTDTRGDSSVAKPKPKPIIEMPKECPPNELWKDCGSRCMDLCESINNAKCDKKCDKGCFCKPGMLRNYNGACIPKSHCSRMMVSGSFKFKFSMSISLSLWVKKYYIVRKQCPKKDRNCQSGQSGDVKPLPSNEKCSQNEEYTTCGDKCVEQCRNLYASENCPLTCQTGCFCKINHYRNNRGVCVPAKKCPGYNQRKYLTSTTTHRPPPRTTTTPPPNRPKATYGTTSTTTQKPVRNVSDSECPVNEKWSNCGSHCRELCENVNAVVARVAVGATSKCPPNMNCMEGCFCVPGFYRDKTDSCVPKNKCPRPPQPTKPPIKCKVNEEYTKCGSKCSESCSVFNETIEKSCPPKCDEGCFCVQGFYRDQFGVCVPQNQCECEIPPQKCRDPKEEYLVCGKNCRQTCEKKSPDCKDTCARGCFCKEGYIYNENGVCTLPNQCGQDIRNGTKEGKRKIVKPGVKCPGDHEKWSDCGNLCEDFCEPKFDVQNCPMTCETGCFCRKGYKRNAADQCVLIDKCNEKPVCADNEAYSDCGSNCATRCKDIGRNRQCPLKCDKGCFCKNGFFRDDEGKCIPRGKCPIDTTPDCGNNEVYKNCSTHCGETCEDLLNPVECPKPEEECDKGCFCAEDYYRDLDGTCGTKLDCNLPPPVTEVPFCEDNEVRRECGNRCDESCEDSVKCKKDCENGCFCVDDYLRNKKGKCVSSDKCKGPPQCAECKQSEYYSDCGTDCGRMCTDIGKNVPCDKDTPCHAGCICKFGFYRTPDGECVTKNECQFFIDEDEELIEYVTTEDPEGIQSPGQKVRARVKAKSFSINTDYDREDYDFEYLDNRRFNNRHRGLNTRHPGPVRRQKNNYGRRRSQESYDDFDDDYSAPKKKATARHNRARWDHYDDY